MGAREPERRFDAVLMRERRDQVRMPGRCVYPALLNTKGTGTLDDTSTSSDGGGERLEKAIRRSVLSQAVQVETSCARGVETSCAVEVHTTS